MNNINDQYNLLKEINQKHLSQVSVMKREYRELVEQYEYLQSQVIQEKIHEIGLLAFNPKYEVSTTKFGIKISSKKGISEDGLRADNENSGLGDYFEGEKLYKELLEKMGPIIKTTSTKNAWFDPPKDSDYNEKTSWVYTEIEYELKRTYLNKEYNFKTAPKSNI